MTDCPLSPWQARHGARRSSVVAAFADNADIKTSAATMQVTGEPRRQDCGACIKSEIRSSKPETNTTLKSEIQKSKSETILFRIAFWLFRFVSNFGFRVSSFNAGDLGAAVGHTVNRAGMVVRDEQRAILHDLHVDRTADIFIILEKAG